MALVLKSRYKPPRVTLNEATRPNSTTGMVKQVGNGRVEIKIIEPGQGATGFYTPPVLAATAAAGLFDNVPICKNHPGTGQRTERPDIDLTVAFIDPGSAKYKDNHPKGPGVYGTATVLEPYRRTMYSYVDTPFGLSIHADGELEREGDTTSNVIRIDKVHSVDLVVKPGAGGAIVGVLESENLKRNNSPHSYPLVPRGVVRKEKKAMPGKKLYEEYVDNRTGERFVYVGNLNEADRDDDEFEESEFDESMIVEDENGNQFLSLPLLEDGSIDEEALQEVMGAVRRLGRGARRVASDVRGGYSMPELGGVSRSAGSGARARRGVERGRQAASEFRQGTKYPGLTRDSGSRMQRAGSAVGRNRGKIAMGAAGAGVAAAGAAGGAAASRRRKEEEDFYEEEGDNILGLIAEGLQGIREDLNDIKNGPAQAQAIAEAANSATRGSNKSRRLVEELAG